MSRKSKATLRRVAEYVEEIQRDADAQRVAFAPRDLDVASRQLRLVIIGRLRAILAGTD